MNEKQRRKVQIEIKRLAKIQTGHTLEIRKEKPHEIYPIKPANMATSKWNALYKPAYLVQQTRVDYPDGTHTGMAYYRESTLEKAKASKKYLERKWEQDIFDKDPEKYS